MEPTKCCSLPESLANSNLTTELHISLIVHRNKCRVPSTNMRRKKQKNVRLKWFDSVAANDNREMQDTTVIEDCRLNGMVLLISWFYQKRALEWPSKCHVIYKHYCQQQTFVRKLMKTPLGLDHSRVRRQERAAVTTQIHCKLDLFLFCLHPPGSFEKQESMPFNYQSHVWSVAAPMLQCPSWRWLGSVFPPQPIDSATYGPWLNAAPPFPQFQMEE